MFITKESIDSFAFKNAGGKGYNLHILSNNGINVPEWIVIGKDFYNKYVLQNNIKNELQNIINTHASNKNFKQIETSVEKLFLSYDFDQQEKNELFKAYKRFDNKLIAVRSSAIGEDSVKNSFAGQLSSFLYVDNFESTLISLKKCWASAYSERSLVYRTKNGISLNEIEVAVVWQEMIDPDKSGVVFTANPVNKNPYQMVVNAVYGVGEGLVSGILDADTFIWDCTSKKLVSSEIACKQKKFQKNIHHVGECIESDISLDMQSKPSLNDDEIKNLTHICEKIETVYKTPQDIEWAIKDGAIYILQARAITIDIPSKIGDLYIWDNSNIIESYGGLTLPLTFSFARYVYTSVYIQFCEILLVPQKEIVKMNSFLKNMLGLLYGRVYYNLINWYKLTSILPGFKYNRSFMETMMGTNESLANEIADRIRPPKSEESFLARIRRFITGNKFIYFHFSIQKIVDQFLAYFYHHYNYYRHINYDNMSCNELLTYYRKLEETFLTKWKAPIINDFLCMVHFGLLKKLTSAWLKSDSLHNDLLCGDGNLESAEPTKEIIRMCNEIKKNSELESLILSCDNYDALEILRQSPFQDFYQRCLQYIDQFGFRCMSEMKLEQRDLHQDSSQLFVFLKNNLKAQKISLHDMEKREHEIRSNAQKLLSSKLYGPKYWIYLWSLHHARKAVRNRENTRFCRTRVYGLVRTIFYAWGKRFVEQNIIDEDRDIFYLTIDELEGTLDGTNNVYNLRKLIDLRKNEYVKYDKKEIKSRFMTRGLVYWKNNAEEIGADDGNHMICSNGSELGNSKSNIIQGIGCSPGVVEGIVKVILTPEDNLDLNGEILVTMRTDPGWVPLFPSAGALLVERGGLLSHSAVVAREMGIPAIVSIPGLTKKLKTGMRVKMNGETGTIEILQ